MQVEVMPGTWQQVAGGTNEFVLPHSLSDIEPNGDRRFDKGVFPSAINLPDVRRMPPGRYRVVYKFAQVEANGENTVAGSWTETHSTQMTVVP